MSALEGQAAEMAEDENNVGVSLTKPSSDEGYTVEEIEGPTRGPVTYKLSLEGGHSYELSNEQLKDIECIDFVDSYDGDPVYVIVNDEGSIKVPTCTFAGDVNTRNMQEALVNCNIVWVFPNASEITAVEMTGHVVAPKALVNLERGHYEGCVIAKKFYGPDTEGHHWPLGVSNPIDPVSATPKVTKVVEGKDAPKDTFEFTIEAVSPTTLPDGYVKTASAQADETAEFAEITYDTVGTYTYKISEVVPDEDDKTAGMQYSDEVITLTVTVGKNEETGELTIEESYLNGDEQSNTITNIYGDPDGTTYEFFVKKDVVSVTYGVDAPTGKVFYFGLSADSSNADAPLPSGAKDGVKVVTITDIGEAGFGDIYFEEEGTYKYIIEELVPEDADTTYTGFAFDETKYVISITIEENKTTHKLEVTDVSDAEALDGSKKGATFLNEYDPVVDLDIPVTKIVTGVARHFDKPTEFTFILKGHGDAPMPKAAVNGELELTITDSQLKDFTKLAYFDTITYIEATKPNEKWVYTITEKAGDVKGFTYSDKEYRLEVVVSNSPEHPELLFTTTTYYEVNKETQELTKVSGITFTNKYVLDPITLQIPVLKRVVGEERTKSTTFTFAIKSTNKAPLPTKKTVDITDDCSLDFVDKVYFDEIKYTDATPANQPYIYEITETKGGGKGWNNSKVTYVVYVYVYHDGKGGMYTEVKAYDKTDLNTMVNIEFTNTYQYDVPDTGDNCNLALWYGLMILSMAGMFKTSYLPRKKKHI